MSNNIYDILKKIENLEGPRQTLTEGKKAKPDYIDIDKDGDKKEPMKKAAKDKARSGMAEAVARVEQQLSEKYSGYKKSLEENAVEESGLQAYLGKKKYGEQGMKALQQAGREGASKEKMAKIRAKHDKMDEADDESISPKSLVQKMSDNDPISQMRRGEAVKPGEYKSPKLLQLPDPKSLLQKMTDNPISQMRRGEAVKPGKMDEDAYNEDMLSPKQKEIASMAGDPDKIDADDFAALRGEKKGKKDEGNEFSGELVKARAQGKDSFEVDGKSYPVKEARSSMREGWEEMQKYLEKKRGPESKGGEGKKAGTRYGGSAQKDDDEDLDGEGQPAVKKKGRPKGTGGGAKFSFKKPKD